MQSLLLGAVLEAICSFIVCDYGIYLHNNVDMLHSLGWYRRVFNSTGTTCRSQHHYPVPEKQARWRYPHCIRRASCLLVFYVLGSYTMGVPGRVFPIAGPGEVHRPG